jgi:hypothetical protein
MWITLKWWFISETSSVHIQNVDLKDNDTFEQVYVFGVLWVPQMIEGALG